MTTTPTLPRTTPLTSPLTSTLITPGTPTGTPARTGRGRRSSVKRSGRRDAAGLMKQLADLESPEAIAEMDARQRRKMLSALKKRIRQIEAAACSGAWQEAALANPDSFPPAADTPACRLRTVRDLDDVQRLQPGQSRQRQYPGIYVNDEGLSIDAAIERTELSRMRLMEELGDTHTGTNSRKSSVIGRGYTGYL